MDRSGPEDVLRHLVACDRAFEPPLSTRVDLADYARKLATQATRMEAWRGGDLIGLVAVYCNAPDLGTAFISNVSLLPDCTGKGIARHLMGRAIQHAHALGFAALTLEVDPRATGAVQLYRSLGFQGAGPGAAGSQKMVLALR